MLVAGKGSTDIFIYPGYKFKMVDALITNFHLPKSTLLMLVSAFSSREIIMDVYKKAVEEKISLFQFWRCDVYLLGGELVRIIAGTAKNKSIKCRKGTETRPTLDRVKRGFVFKDTALCRR